MRHRATARGFTIIETLIFLTVSSFVFVAAIGQYSAQQHQVQFNQGVRGLQADLLSMISEVSSSFAPDLSAYHCTADTSNGALVITPGAGDNSDCVFMGKALGFGGNGTSYCAANSIDSCSHYVTIPIVGRRQYFTAGQGAPAASLAEAKPLGLSSCSTGAGYATTFPCGAGSLVNSPPDLATRKPFGQGIGIYKAFLRSSAGANIGDISGVAFVFNLSSSSYSSDDSAGAVDLAYLKAAGPPAAAFTQNDETKTATAIAAMGDANLNPKDGISLCLMDGYGKTAVITVGANNSKTDVSVEPASKFASGGCF